MKVIEMILIILALLVGFAVAIIVEQNRTPVLPVSNRTPTRLTSTRLPVTIRPASSTPTRTRTLTPTPTKTATPTLTPTKTRIPPVFNVLIHTCDTGIDLASGLGEVTNAYVTVQNVGETGATGVVVTLAASDEEESHADKSYHVGYLPAGQEISLKLTVDTRNLAATSLTAGVTSAERVSASAEAGSCRSRRPEQEIIESMGELFQIKDIESGE